MGAKIVDIDIENLLAVALRTRADAWRVRKHPERDGKTIYSRMGYVIHPGLGYVNDDADADFIAAFDPPTVIYLLERLRSAEARG